MYLWRKIKQKKREKERRQDHLTVYVHNEYEEAATRKSVSHTCRVLQLLHIFSFDGHTKSTREHRCGPTFISLNDI